MGKGNGTQSNGPSVAPKVAPKMATTAPAPVTATAPAPTLVGQGVPASALLVGVALPATIYRQGLQYLVVVAGKVVAQAKAGKGGASPYPAPPQGGRWRWLFTEGGGAGAIAQASFDGQVVQRLVVAPAAK